MNRDRYEGKCGSCKHFSFYVKDGEVVMRGQCYTAPTNYYNHNNRHGQKYKAKHGKYRIASCPKCSRYIKGDEE